jgi:hypothetical protein
VTRWRLGSTIDVVHDAEAMRWIAAFLLVPALTSCAIGSCHPEFEALAVEESGMRLPDRADGLGVECRGLEASRCLEMAEGELPGVDVAESDRIVVSCVGQCTPRGGETRIDVIQGDQAILIANGGYGEFEQSCN